MKFFVLLPCALLGMAGTAAAQASDTPAEPCQAQPQGGNEKSPPATGDTTSTLAPCGGVLQPPPSGDQDMTQPPPDQGKTPVIKPGEVPAQPPKQ